MHLPKLLPERPQRVSRGGQKATFSQFLQNAGNLPCGVDRTKYAAVMLALQKKEEQRMQTLTMYKGKGKNALGIEDFTLKTMLGRGGFGKVQITTD